MENAIQQLSVQPDALNWALQYAGYRLADIPRTYPV